MTTCAVLMTFVVCVVLTTCAVLTTCVVCCSDELSCVYCADDVSCVCCAVCVVLTTCAVCCANDVCCADDVSCVLCRQREDADAVRLREPGGGGARRSRALAARREPRRPHAQARAPASQAHHPGRREGRQVLGEAEAEQHGECPPFGGRPGQSYFPQHWTDCS